MTTIFHPRYRGLLIAGALLAVALGASGCSPLITLAGAALGGLGSGTAGGGAPATSGIIGGGAPTLAQHTRTASPVQNPKPTEQAIHDVLDHVDNQEVRESCLKSLPPESKVAVTECTTRLACIPGVSTPLMMRTCPAESAEVQVADQTDMPVRSAYAGPTWSWNDSKAVLTTGE